MLACLDISDHIGIDMKQNKWQIRISVASDRMNDLKIIISTVLTFCKYIAWNIADIFSFKCSSDNGTLHIFTDVEVPQNFFKALPCIENWTASFLTKPSETKVRLLVTRCYTDRWITINILISPSVLEYLLPLDKIE